MADIRLDSLPSWAPFAIIGGVVALLVMAQRSGSGSGGGGGMIGDVTTLAPAPADPNVIAEMESETAARAQGFSDLVGLFGTQVQSNRDVAISQLNADVQKNKTAAQLNASNYAESVQHDVGIAATNASVAIEQARATASVDITNSQGATAKYVAKKQNNPLNHLIDQAGSIFSGLSKLFK